MHEAARALSAYAESGNRIVNRNRSPGILPGIVNREPRRMNANCWRVRFAIREFNLEVNTRLLLRPAWRDVYEWRNRQKILLAQRRETKSVWPVWKTLLSQEWPVI